LRARYDLMGGEERRGKGEGEVEAGESKREEEEGRGRVGEMGRTADSAHMECCWV